MASHKKTAAGLLYAAIAAAGLSAACGFYNGLSLRRYTLQSDKLSGRPLRTVLLSDLHGTVYGRGQKRLIRAVQGQAPDLILFAGDIVDDIRPWPGSLDLIAGLAGTAPCYYAMGNHEHRSRQSRAIAALLTGMGVHVLQDEAALFRHGGGTLLISGIRDIERRRREDPLYNQDEAMHRAFGGLRPDDGMYKILLAHRPENILRYRRYPFDLVLSGHAHGGQVRIPFLANGLFSPGQGILPPYAGGLYCHGQTTHIVSRGLSRYPLLPRVFNPPELVSIVLEPTP